MITDYYIIATLIYLSCMGVVYWFWRRRDIDRREFLLLFLVGLLMVWASPILMKRLGPTTLVLVYTLIPLTAAVISTRIGKEKDPGQDDKLVKLETPIDSELPPLTEFSASGQPENNVLLPENKRKSNYTVRRWSDLGPQIRLHSSVAEHSDEQKSEAAAAALESAVEGIKVEVLPEERPVEALTTDNAEGSADIIESVVQVSASVSQDDTEPLKESLTEVLDIETTESEPETEVAEEETVDTAEPADTEIIEETAEGFDENLPAADETELIDDTVNIMESGESEPETEVAEEETVDTAEPADTEIIEATAEGSDQNLPAVDANMLIDEDIEMIESEGQAAGEAVEPAEEGPAESGIMETVNPTEDIIVPIDGEAVDEEAENGPLEDSLLIEETEAADDSPETAEADKAEPVTEVAGETAEDITEAGVSESDDEFGEAADELSGESLLDVEETDAVNEKVVMAEELTIADEEIVSPNQERTIVSDLVTDRLSDSEHVVKPSEEHDIDKITEKAETEQALESAVDQVEDNTIIGQQSGDIMQEIRHNIAEGNLSADKEDEYSRDIEAGIMPVLSEQKQVKSARQRMMEEKVNRLLDAGFDAKFSGNWTQAIQRFADALKITDDASLRGMLVRDIGGMYLELADYEQAEMAYQSYLTYELTEDERKEIQREIARLRLMAQELSSRGMPLMPYRKVPRLLQIKVDDLLNRSDISKQVEGSKKRK